MTNQSVKVLVAMEKQVQSKFEAHSIITFIVSKLYICHNLL